MKIAVLLSGGVDSSVALRLLQDQGYTDITAYYLKIWLEDELAFIGECPWKEDLEYVREVCKQANVPIEIISFQSEYHDKVVSFALEELKAGRTPSPDIHCNERIKFGAFFDKLEHQFDKVASGHYAILEQNDGDTCLLKKAPDPIKDQTYFLSNLSQAQLKKIIFPIGKYTKEQVRELAKKYNLPNQKRKDSQGICFLGKIHYPDFVRFHLGEQKGDIIEVETGKKWGEHQGFWFYTIGQRKGLGLGQGPWYVVKKDLEKNIIYISHSDHSLQQAKNEFNIHKVNWISGQSPIQTDLSVKLRHGPEAIPCKFTHIENNQYHIHLSKKDQGIASGQHAVLYDEDTCLGGGVIL